MKEFKTLISEKIDNLLAARGVEFSSAELLEHPADPKNGDISFPCFRLAKLLRKAPPLIANDLANELSADSAFEKVEAVNGYLNFFVSKKYFAEKLREINADPNFGSTGSGQGKTICLDFSSPNIAKRFHLGHVGTTVIGNALRNMFDFEGYKTVAINYLGDWGTQFGKLIVAYKMWSSREAVEKRGLSELEDIYIRFNRECENDPTLADKGRAAFHELESGNEEYLEIWRYFREISLREYEKTYELLGIKFDSYNGEAFYTDKMPAIVEELKQKNLLKQDDGAYVVDLSEYNMPPALILKRDGSTLYPTRDIAAAKWRKQEYDFDKCIYVTSAGQSLHFAQWFKVVELMGYDWAKDLVHVPYGTMSFNGQKLASRTGNIIHLDELFASAAEKALAIIEEKNAALPDKEETARAIGCGAIVFNALFNNRMRDTDFNWDTALSFEGNTGPYVQYTYARASSVLRKAGNVSDNFGDYEPVEAEISLIKQMLSFGDKVEQALSDYEPSVVTRYMLGLCSSFNIFYHDCPVMKADDKTKAFRVALTAAVKNVVGKCLDLLGMKRTEEI